jgi:hypothetical protein
MSDALVLSFEGAVWRARGRGIDVAHDDLRGLEALIEARVCGAAAVEVRLEFDMAALPRWLHQYQTHYCNYTLRVPARPRA